MILWWFLVFFTIPLIPANHFQKFNTLVYILLWSRAGNLHLWWPHPACPKGKNGEELCVHDIVIGFKERVCYPIQESPLCCFVRGRSLSVWKKQPSIRRPRFKKSLNIEAAYIGVYIEMLGVAHGLFVKTVIMPQASSLEVSHVLIFGGNTFMKHFCFSAPAF